jgi:monovalent cation:proton antiporter-2 (CPA2) family protein
VAAIVVPVFHRFKMSPVLGFLLAGVVIGPFGLAIIDRAEDVKTLAEFGIIFLLFLIGLELSFDRLWTMRRLVFGLGAAQVVVTGCVIGLIAWAWGNAVQTSIILGACLALSSTAVVIQLLSERGEFSSHFGRSTFGILLFQDLAVVPILVLVTVLGSGGEASLVKSLGFAAGKAVLAIGIIVVLGRLLLRPLFRLVTRTRIPELFVALTLLAVIGTAVLTGLSGLSMALGAFLAGLLIAETEFRHQVEIDIQPFKGLLLGVFFLSVGMGIDITAVADQVFWVAGAVAGLIIIKALIATGLCLIFGLSRSIAIQTGLYLGQAGEFAFVVVGLALTFSLVPIPVGQFMLIVASLSMVVTPLVAYLGRRLGERLATQDAAAQLGPDQAKAEDTATGHASHVIIAGFGRVGQTVAKLLKEQNIPFTALDLDAQRIAACRNQGLPVFYGDARRADVLARVGAAEASSIVITLDEPAAASQAITNFRRQWPEVPIYARARDMAASVTLRELGADHVVPETVESSLQLSTQLLSGLGFPASAVEGLIERIRQQEYTLVRPVIDASEKSESSST